MRLLRQGVSVLVAGLMVATTLGVVELGSEANAPVIGTSRVAHAGHGLSHATIKIWNPNATSPTLGFDPNMTVADTGGVTLHVATPANPLTVVTVYENTICSGFPCGVTYWNPATNVFKCYGYSSGEMTGVDVNVSAPAKTGPDGTVYRPGDVWLAKTGLFSTSGSFTGGSESLSVQFPGTNSFRSWNAGNLSSVEVEQTTGLVWYAERFNFIGLFDPATNTSRRWNVGGAPRDIESDGAGNAYATVGPASGQGNEIVRINRITGLVTKWAVPGGGPGAIRRLQPKPRRYLGDRQRGACLVCRDGLQ